jgi:phospholipid/cholesterol/gamma-HCH transport system substrate-binding protein
MINRDDLAETLIGLAVVVVAALFFVFAAQQGGAGPAPAGYSVKAAFPRVDGVAKGTEVRLSGVKVGAVTDVTMLPNRNYWVMVEFTLRSDVKIPTDSTARILADGLLGGAHLALEAGGAEEALPPGAELMNTEGSMDLLSLLSAFSGGGDGAGKTSADQPAPAPQ